MTSMLDYLGLKLQGHHHSGLDDRRNIARILQALLQQGAVVEERVLSFSSSTRGARELLEEGKGKGSRGPQRGKGHSI